MAPVSSRTARAPSPTPSRSMRERRRQHRLAEILEAGFEEFAQRGYAATRLEDVGQRVSLTRGAIYLYFKDKEELFRLLLMTFYHEIARDHRRSRLLRVLVADGPNFPELTEFYYSEVIQHGIDCFKFAIKRGIDRGEF